MLVCLSICYVCIMHDILLCGKLAGVLCAVLHILAECLHAHIRGTSDMLTDGFPSIYNMFTFLNLI
jgi:hypothetical protein